MEGNSLSFLHSSSFLIQQCQYMLIRCQDGITAKPSAERVTRVEEGIHQCVAQLWNSIIFFENAVEAQKWITFLGLFLNTAIFCNMVTAFHDISVEEVEEELVDGGRFSKPFCWHTFCG